MARKAIPVDTKLLVLHEAGYVCGNPACRCIVTLDMHHLDPVADGGPNDPANLLALCPNCHRRHHNKEIPIESLRAWKMLLVALNHAYDRHSIDVLLLLFRMEKVWITGDGLLGIASAVAAGLIDAKHEIHTIFTGQGSDGRMNRTAESRYELSLSTKGKTLVEAWVSGRQELAVGA
jgi:hypothetical protein